MAIGRSAKTLHEYRQHYRNQLICILIAILSTILISLGVTLHSTGVAQIATSEFWVIMLTILSVGIISLITAARIIADPLCKILAALAHKTGEPTTQAPPNPNDKQYAQTGFKIALQAIYDTTNPTITPTSSRDSFLTQALNHTSCGVAILNDKKQIVFANAAVPTAKDLNGTSYLALEFMNEPTITEWIDEIANDKIKAERRWHRVATNPNVIKKTKIYDIVASYDKGTINETVVFLIDKSHRYLPEEDDLNFISFAAHELRGPITVIRGYLDIIVDEFADRFRGDEAQLMDRLIVSANRLSSYVDNILNVSRFDRHHLKVHLLEDTVANIYASIEDDMNLRASTQHRLLQVNIPPDLPTVAADRGSISEVISNLIDNAIKYSFEGGVIVVTAEKRGDFIEISVADNGIGMPANVVNNLFHKFYRSHRSRESVAGTGIGLYICKAFVESHGGSITARSKENEGSVFSFTLPIYATVKDKLLEDGQLNNRLIRKGGGWIKNHAMYRD